MPRIMNLPSSGTSARVRLGRFARSAVVIWATLFLLCVSRAAQAQVLSLDQTVAQVQTVNPQVRAARLRWESSLHQIKQNLTPVDPQFSYSDLDSWRGFLKDSGTHNLTVTQSLQFPGKGLLQARQAERTADIAHLIYLAALRDLIAQTRTAYYQIQLDVALEDLIRENVANLARVLDVTQIAYTANRATQGDFINAKFALEADREQERQQAVTIANDKTMLNMLLNRRPDEPLEVDRKFDLTPFENSLDRTVDHAVSNRQEILEAALAEKNDATAITLAQLEYAPDYTLGFGFDHWLISSFAPSPNHTETWNFSIAFNLPVFFWAKNEDIAKARKDLDAAREDLESIRTQTAGQVTTTYRQILRSRETALLYRDTLIPLAHQAFEVMLVAYQGGKTDFTTLISTFRQQSDARSTYLQAVNQLLAQKVALEAAAGGSLQ
ncbi:MAG TPA: TolC family protein [Candidatus Binataceae bacterium]|nr:TolC family protein [Candidatus Binataceae bacterium]